VQFIKAQTAKRYATFGFYLNITDFTLYATPSIKIAKLSIRPLH